MYSYESMTLYAQTFAQTPKLLDPMVQWKLITTITATSLANIVHFRIPYHSNQG